MGDICSAYFETKNGVRLHYLEAGVGPTLIILPGWTPRSWKLSPKEKPRTRGWPGLLGPLRPCGEEGTSPRQGKRMLDGAYRPKPEGSLVKVSS